MAAAAGKEGPIVPSGGSQTVGGIPRDALEAYLTRKVDEDFDVQPDVKTMVTYIMKHFNAVTRWSSFRSMCQGALTRNLTRFMGDETDKFVTDLIEFGKSASISKAQSAQPSPVPSAMEECPPETKRGKAESSLTNFAEELQGQLHKQRKNSKGRVREGRRRSRSPAADRSSRQRIRSRSRDWRLVRAMDDASESADDDVADAKNIEDQRRQLLCILKGRRRRYSRDIQSLERRATAVEAMIEKVKKADPSDDNWDNEQRGTLSAMLDFLQDDTVSTSQTHNRLSGKRVRRIPLKVTPPSRHASKDLVGHWSIHYKNRFRTHYEIVDGGRRVRLPVSPPRSSKGRQNLYGDSIHGWNGAAAISPASGRNEFYIHPPGYDPACAPKGRRDRTVWERIHVEDSDYFSIKFFCGARLVTSGQGRRTRGRGDLSGSD